MPNKNKFYSLSKIRADSGGVAGRLNIYGTIEATEFWGDEFTPSRFISELNALGEIEQLDVHIFSNGGDVFAGLAIYSLLRQRDETVNIYIEGISASIATVITCAGDNVYIADTAMMMVHNPFASLFFTSLNSSEARDLADELDMARKPMLAAYTAKTGKSEEDIISMLDGKNGKGTWFTAAEAIAAGLADDYIPDNKRSSDMAACLKPAVYSYRGHIIDLSKFPDAAKMTSGITKHTKGVKNQMSKFLSFGKRNRKKKAKVIPRRRAEAALIETECPYCNEIVLLNPETAEVSINSSPDDAEAIVEARRIRNQMRAEVFEITCPACGEDYVWDTDENSDGDAGETVTETNTADLYAKRPMIGAKSTKKTKAAKKAKTRAELRETPCPDCTTMVEYDTEAAELTTDENGVEGYNLTCQECGVIFFEPLENNDSVGVPDSTDIAAAYRRGVMAERKRMLALDEMLIGAPAMNAMLTKAKKTGASVESMSKNIFKAMAHNPKIKNSRQLESMMRDAEDSGINDMQLPSHYDDVSEFAEIVSQRLEDR